MLSGNANEHNMHKQHVKGLYINTDNMMQFLNRQLQGILTILTIFQALKILRGETHMQATSVTKITVMKLAELYHFKLFLNNY